MAHKIDTISLRNIYLDNINPRHDPIDNEPQIIEYLLGKELVANLAKDIAKLGTSPLERFAVIPHPASKGSYVAVEGNRRICALKLLSDPDKAPKEQVRKLFRQLAGTMPSKPKAIEAIIFSTREEARPWLDRRHSGARDGIGARPWTPRQKARFDNLGGAPTNPNIQADLLLQYALTAGLITQTQHDQINVTTLTRFLSNPIFRNALGLDSGRGLSIHVPKIEFDRAATRFLKDAIKGPKGSVHSRTNKKEREAYAHRLGTENVAVTTRLTASQELNASTGKAKGPAGAAAKGGSKPRHSRSPDERHTVIPSDFVFPLRNKILKRIYDELRSIDAEEYSFAAAYLLRAMVEQSVKVFCKDNQVSHGPNVKLHVLIQLVVKKLVSEGVEDKKLKMLRVMANDQDDRTSPESLGNFVHGGDIPTRKELIRRWDSIEDSLKILLSRLK